MSRRRAVNVVCMRIRPMFREPPALCGDTAGHFRPYLRRRLQVMGVRGPRVAAAGDAGGGNGGAAAVGPLTFPYRRRGRCAEPD